MDFYFEEQIEVVEHSLEESCHPLDQLVYLVAVPLQATSKSTEIIQKNKSTHHQELDA